MTAVAPATDPGTAAPARRYATSSRNPGVVLVLFALALVAGIGARVGLEPREAPPAYPSIATTFAEPAPAAEMTRAVTEGDAAKLAHALPDDVLKTLQEAMAPVVDIEDIEYVGGVERGGETLAAYVVRGKDAMSRPLVVGFVA